jgi:uncharacterized membrane protein
MVSAGYTKVFAAGVMCNAVTLGILIKDTGSSFRENLITALCTITAQIAGGFLGVLFVLIAVNMDVPIE